VIVAERRRHKADSHIVFRFQWKFRALLWTNWHAFTVCIGCVKQYTSIQVVTVTSVFCTIARAFVQLIIKLEFGNRAQNLHHMLCAVVTLFGIFDRSTYVNNTEILW